MTVCSYQGSQILTKEDEKGCFCVVTEFYVKVEPGSDEFKVEKGAYPKIFLCSEAENGRANTELIRRLESLLDVSVGIVSGHHSSRKKIVAELEKRVIEKRIYGE